MSALPMSVAAAGRRHRTLAVLGACSARWQQWAALLVYALCVAGAAAVLLSAPRPQRAQLAATLLLALGTAGLWSFWFSRTLLLRLDARRTRTPGVARAIAWALAWAFAMTVALPALALVAVGVAPGFAFSALAAGALFGLLAPLLPGGAVLALCLLPWLQGLLRALLGYLPAWPGAQFDWHWQPQHVPWLAGALALLAWWRWRVLVRDGDTLVDASWLRKPLLLGTPAASGDDDAGLGGRHWVAQAPDWFWPAGQVGRAGPDTPVRAMRAWLGTPFAPLSRRQALLQYGIVLLMVVVLVNGAALGMSQYGALGAVMPGLGMVGYAFAGRLQTMCRRPSGELAELALLPGWGDAASARRTLLRALRAVLVPTGALTLLALWGLVRLIDGADLTVHLLVLAIWLGAMLVTAVFCLRPLCGRRFGLVAALGLLAPGVLLLMVSTIALMLQSALPSGGPAWPLPSWLLLVWLLFCLGHGGYLLWLWRRFHARAHPFLQT